MDQSDVNPVQRLALVYAKHDVKAAWALLLAFDSRIGEIVLNASEPLIAQMKLVWWNDAISTPSESRPKGEPMLAQLSQWEDDGCYLDLAPTMKQLLDAWELLLANESWSDELLESHARQRGGAIFGSYMNWTGLPTGQATGAAWALDDLAVRSGEVLLDTLPKESGLPRALSILAMAARHQRTPKRLSGIHLIFHGLTGL